jgi:NADPH:quinone reductase-like Zn-dependent oxidoreductase
MRAAMIRRHGSPADVLRLEEAPTPQPAAGEILIAVAAVGLNHLDVFACQGLTGPGVRGVHLPHVSGVDVAGTVAGRGPGVDGPPRGSRVLVNPAIGCGACRQCRRGEPTMCPDYTILGEHRWGGLADYVTAPARNVVPLPDAMPFVQAAAVPAAYTTAWRAMVTVGRVRPGERVLIVGASGGVGCAALQIAARVGAEVLAIAGSPAKRRRALELGAVAAFDSHTRWIDDVKRWTAAEGVDLVHDAVGAPTWRQSIQSLAMGGRLIVSGATGGDRPEISIRELYQRHGRILGAPMGNWQDFLDVTRLVCRRAIVPEVHAVYPLEQVAEAESVLDRREHFGKIVVRVAPGSDSTQDSEGAAIDGLTAAHRHEV